MDEFPLLKKDWEQYGECLENKLPAKLLNNCVVFSRIIRSAIPSRFQSREAGGGKVLDAAKTTWDKIFPGRFLVVHQAAASRN